VLPDLLHSFHYIPGVRVAMGVPGFFRWLKKKYPEAIVRQVLPELAANGADPAQAQSKPRQGDDASPETKVVALGEFDNLYLDMNGMVHPATHGEGRKVRHFSLIRRLPSLDHSILFGLIFFSF